MHGFELKLVYIQTKNLQQSVAAGSANLSTCCMTGIWPFTTKSRGWLQLQLLEVIVKGHPWLRTKYESKMHKDSGLCYSKELGEGERGQEDHPLLQIQFSYGSVIW